VPFALVLGVLKEREKKQSAEKARGETEFLPIKTKKTKAAQCSIFIHP
jgi:hypothetical protein